jgi:hypothetical protein
MCKPGNACGCSAGRSGSPLLLIPAAIPVCLVIADWGQIVAIAGDVLHAALLAMGAVCAVATVLAMTVIRRHLRSVGTWKPRQAMARSAASVQISQRRPARIAAPQRRALPAPTAPVVHVITSAQREVSRG